MFFDYDMTVTKKEKKVLGTNQQTLVDALNDLLKTRKLPITFFELVDYAVERSDNPDKDKARMAFTNSLNSVKVDRYIVFNRHDEIIEFRPNGVKDGAIITAK